jgi:hypothetical protein
MSLTLSCDAGAVFSAGGRKVLGADVHVPPASRVALAVPLRDHNPFCSIARRSPSTSSSATLGPLCCNPGFRAVTRVFVLL